MKIKEDIDWINMGQNEDMGRAEGERGGGLCN